MKCFHQLCIPLLLVTLLISESESKRVRVRPVHQEDEEQYEDKQQPVEYYEAVPQDSQDQRVVYISAADQYNGLYGQPSASSRSSQQDNYIQPVRGLSKTKTKEPSKSPPVQTIRNYNKVNDDGSFTFGYEAADGSFKEETRGTDCVVRGKYGYVDPDGNKREFTYVSGNPCDPNAPKEEQEPERDQDRSREVEKDDDGVPNYPNYPNYPIRPVQRPIQRPVVTTPAPKPSVTLFQNNYVRDEEEEEEEEEDVPVPISRPQPVQPIRSRPSTTIYIPRPQYVEQPQTEAPRYQTPKYLSIPSTTPSSLIYKNTITPISITPRPTPRPEPVTTYRPQTLQLSVTPKSPLLFTKPLSAYATRPSYITTPSPSYSSSYTPSYPSYTSSSAGSRGNLDFDAEFQKFQQENTIVSSTPTSVPKAVTKAATLSTPKANPTLSNSGQVYSSALVYDPKSGQYNTQLYQALPQTDGDFTLNQKIQPYVFTPQQQLLNFQQLQSQSPLYRGSSQSGGRQQQQQQQQHQQQQPSQALYQQQQAELQFQNSAQLYAQQQKARQQQQSQQPQSQPTQTQQQTSPQQFYYVQPQPSYTGGQIDAFLRGHNIQF
ncbi:uncharacterized protein [Onthophagus taurus]|uniref:uncharacterized protein n=1 Tax=Onthophagus taurus TaxID=166361 RepID=UPI0039BE1752